jgi:uncharacterized phiE125 gp8 family phage protein
MPLTLLTGPAAEPVTLADMKAHLRLDTSDEDDLVTALISAARLQVESRTRRALITQTWRLWLDRWPTHTVLSLKLAPLRAVTAARVFNQAGVATPVPTSAFQVLGGAPGRILFTSVPAPGRAAGGIEIDVEAGYGPMPADVPADLRQSVRLLAAFWFENRALLPGGTAEALPAGLDALLAPFRLIDL